MDFIDYYTVLGIDQKATESDIKAAYRKLARKYHPDLNPNDKDAHKKFQQINEANEVLSDPENRKKYDAYGKDWKHADQFEQQKSNQQSNHFNEQSFTNDSGADYSNFFESIFGGGKSQRQSKFKGRDYNAELHLDLMEAQETHQHTLTVNGKNIRITIPAGVENGQTIKLKEYGEPGVNGGPAGDLFITFVIASDPVFKRSGNDLYVQAEVDLYTAILGGEMMIDTLKGKVKLTVKPSTQSGSKIRLKGKGFPVYKKEGAFGDLYVTYQIKIPSNISDKQKELFTQLRDLE